MSYCPTCKKEVEGDICPTCSTPTEAVKEKRPVIRRLSGTPTESTGAEPVPFSPPPEPQPEARERKPEPGPRTREAPPPPRPLEPGVGRSASAVSPRRFEGEAELEAFIAQGYEIFLVAGIAGVGKSELLSAFGQDGFLGGFQKRDGMVMATIPRTLQCHPIHFGNGRKGLFVDASGEDFRLLYPDAHTGIGIDEADISFLRLIAKRLRGLILLVELERLWDERLHAADPSHAKQVQILAWILSLLRWLTLDGRYNQENNPIKFTKHVDAATRTMTKRLKVPVQVLFSKADQLAGYPIPQGLQGADWLRQGSVSERKLFPLGENPLLFTYHCLRGLYKAIDVHADNFRFDFAHSLVTRKGPGTVADPDPCGVALAVQWLLDPCWSSSFTPVISTRRWVALQRSLDKVVGRGRRWTRLPDPKEISA